MPGFSFRRDESVRNEALCIGSSYTRNYGDRAIFRVLKQTLRSQGNVHARPFPLKPVVANRRGASMGFIRKTLTGLVVLPRHYSRMSRRVRTVATVIVGGGNLIHDVHPLTVLQFALAAITVRLSGRHFLVFGIGAGPLGSWYSRLCVGIGCALSDGVIVRDTYSHQILERCPGNSNWLRPKIVPDVVLSLDRDAAAAPRVAREMKIGISVMCYMMPDRFPGGSRERYRDYLIRMEDLVRALIAEFGCEVLLFSNEPSEDQVTVDELHERLKDLGKVSRMRVRCLSEAIRLPGSCDYHIGARLHSLIFSLSQGVPSVALASHGRISGLFVDLDARDLVHDISNFEPASVVRSLKELKDGRSVPLLAMVDKRRREAREGLSEMVAEIEQMERAFFGGGKS